ncbi:MAG: multidrug effflux MFS transporter [Nevskia sp.]|nr:multidrug effflux MFS transporter [Nevskia sp.]
MNRFRANPRLLAPLLAGLAMLGPFSIDTFFPAFGRMEREFSIGAVAMQQTLSLYMSAFAVMSLLHGPLSDAYGRRGVIFYALLLYLGATCGCALAPSFHWLLTFRMLQGISAGAGMIVGRAIIRDRFAGADAQRLMSQVTLIFGVAPALAPIVGGWVLYFAGWRWIFWVLAVFTVVLLLTAQLALPETHPRARRMPFDARHLLRTYRGIAADARFMLLALTASLNFSAIFLYVASAPSIVLDLLHLSERQFAWLFIPTIGGMTFGAGLSGRLAGKLDAARTVGLGYLLILAGALLNLAINSLLAPAVPWFVLPIAVGGMGVSLAFPTLTLLMLDRFPATRGAAASVQAATSIAASAAIGGLLSPAVCGHGLVLALAGAALSGCGYGCWRLYRRLAKQESTAVATETC